MEVNENNSTIFNAGRFFGLAPYLVVSRKRGKINGTTAVGSREIKRSIILCIYSTVLLGTIGGIYLTFIQYIFGLHFQLNILCEFYFEQCSLRVAVLLMMPTQRLRSGKDES